MNSTFGVLGFTGSLTWLDVHVHQRHGVDVLEAPRDLQQQVLHLQLRQVAEPPVVVADDVRQRAAVAVLVLDEHVVVLGPRRVVAHHVGVLAQHGMSVHLPQGILPVVGWEEKEKGTGCFN